MSISDDLLLGTQDSTLLSRATETSSLYSAIEFRLWQLMRKKLFHALRPRKIKIADLISPSKRSSDHEVNMFAIGGIREFDKQKCMQAGISGVGTLFDESDEEINHELIDEQDSARFDDLSDMLDDVDDDELPQDLCRASFDDWDEFEALEDMHFVEHSNSSMLEQICEDDPPLGLPTHREPYQEIFFRCEAPCEERILPQPPLLGCWAMPKTEQSCDILDDGSELLSEGLFSDSEEPRNLVFSSQSTAGDVDDMLDGL